jgi:hypothetical protein
MSEERIAPVSLIHEGNSGFWFPRGVALEILGDLRELPIRQRQIALLEEELELREGQLDRLREMVDLERRASQEAISGLDTTVERARNAEEALQAWWRSPLLWVGVGVVIAIALEVAAVAVLANI